MAGVPYGGMSATCLVHFPVCHDEGAKIMDDEIRRTIQEEHESFLAQPAPDEEPGYCTFDEIMRGREISQKIADLKTANEDNRLTKISVLEREVKAINDWLNGTREAPTTGHALVGHFNLESKTDWSALSGEQQKTARKKSGRKAAPLREVVEHLYQKLKEEGDIAPLETGNVGQFIERLRALRNAEQDEFFSSRIESVKKVGGKWIINTEEQIVATTKTREVLNKSRKYTQNDVSKILTSIRKK